LGQFDDIFSQVSGLSLLEQQGETVTYDPVTGASVSRTAIITEESGDALYDDDLIGDKRMAEMKIRNDATLGVADPVRGDKVTVSGHDWFVHSWSTTDTFHTVRIVGLDRETRANANTTKTT